MSLRTRPQRPIGVNRWVGIWQWLQRLIVQTHTRHQFKPRRFTMRGLLIALLVLVPGVLWLRSVFRGAELPSQRWTRGSCPPSAPHPVRDLLQHPERFRHRIVWVAGTLQIAQRQCLSRACPPSQPDCCQPCQARLGLLDNKAFVLIDGWLPNAQGRVQRLACRGTTCRLSCAPLKVRQHYAMAGIPQVEKVSHPTDPRPRFRLRSLRVVRFCPLNKAPLRRRPSLPDPRYRSPQRATALPNEPRL